MCEMPVLRVTHWEVVGAVAAHQGVLVLQFQGVRLALAVAVLMLETEAAQLLVELQEPEVLLVCEGRCVESQSWGQSRSGEELVCKRRQRGSLIKAQTSFHHNGWLMSESELRWSG